MTARCLALIALVVLTAATVMASPARGDHNQGCRTVPGVYYVCSEWFVDLPAGFACWFAQPETGDPHVDHTVRWLLDSFLVRSEEPPPPRDPGCYVGAFGYYVGGEAFSPGHEKGPSIGYRLPGLK
ncbi:MAG TPA: hypothetical protein VM681_07770 [Candidatus Thermoplasmatota archaeon]|nr:hypothetical protein [Candidatus Thermoplasmatota archaeon]